jgi:hypothetical protein
VDTRLTFKTLKARRAQQPEPQERGDELAIVRTPAGGLAWARGGLPVSLGELIDSVPHHLVEWVVAESLRATESAERAHADFGELDDDLVRLALAVRGMCAPPQRAPEPAVMPLAA